MKKINIAIDGPAGAGKSTISKLLAKTWIHSHRHWCNVQSNRIEGSK